MKLKFLQKHYYCTRLVINREKKNKYISAILKSEKQNISGYLNEWNDII